MTTTEVDNDQRADWAHGALRASAAVQHLAHVTRASEEGTEAFGDLLCNLRHLADRRGLDWQEIYDHAMSVYAEERADEEDQEVPAGFTHASRKGQVIVSEHGPAEIVTDTVEWSSAYAIVIATGAHVGVWPDSETGLYQLAETDQAQEDEQPAEEVQAEADQSATAGAAPARH